MVDARVLVIGATGMVGGHALRDSLEREEVGEVRVIGRRATGLAHAKLREVVHADLADYGAVSEALVGQDVALFCLGAYTGALSDAEFKRVTVDYTVAFAQALYAGSPNAAVCFLSGAGADPGERSRMAFARYKGAAEKALLATGFARVHIFRPGYIYPVEARTEPNFSYRMMRALYPALRRVYPNVGLGADALAWAMVEVGLRGAGDHASPVLENRDIRALAERRGAL